MAQMREFKMSLMEDLKNADYAQVYLKEALDAYEKDHNAAAFLMALRDVAKARGGIAKLAQKTSLNRQNLYKSLSAKGAPKLDTVESVLHGLGYRLSIEPLSETRV